jgi:hypothetical protein
MSAWTPGAWAAGAWAGTAWQEAAPVEVPDVVGQSQASATAEIEGAGFVAAVVLAYSDSVPVGAVISQLPLAGALASAGATVTITVSLGAEPVTVGSKPRKRPRNARIDVGDLLGAAADAQRRDDEELAAMVAMLVAAGVI